MKNLVFVVTVFVSQLSIAADFFQDKAMITQRLSARAVDETRWVAKARQARYLLGDTAQLQQVLAQNSVDLSLPLPNGDTAIYHLAYAPIAEQGFLDQFPAIRTFRGTDVNNPNNRGRFDISPSGFRGMFWHNGKRVFIDPEHLDTEGDYLSYYAADALPLSTMPEDFVLGESPEPVAPLARRLAAKGSSDGVLRTYRLAVAATGEYTAFFGSQSAAAAAIITTINRVNDVFENDMGIHLQLVADNASLIYSDGANDPYFNIASSSELSRNQLNIDEVIGTSGYDIGHLFATDIGGTAFIGAACNDSFKAGGFTGLPSPTGEPFYIDFVAHELGHQFGANHTFNATAAGCDNDRFGATAYEPGSGSTIMAYAGICPPQNLQSRSDAYFHAASIAEMTAFVTNPSTGGSCGTESMTLNAVPDVNAGPDVTIPANTPFVLSGSATDGDGNNTLTYVWEQFDIGAASSSPATMVDDGSRPLFRSVLPTSSPTRYFPRLSDVVLGNSTLGETYPTTNRNLNFRLTARDNSLGSGATAYDDKVVTVSTSAGPFAVTVPSNGNTWSASTATVSWDVANTQLAPVNCTAVDILLSVDGGLNFNSVLLANILNDGSAIVSVPRLNNTQARVMVRCSDNVFFAVNNGPFVITTSAVSVSAVSGASATEGNNLSFTVSLSSLSTAGMTTTFHLGDISTTDADYGAVSFSDGVTEASGLLTIPTGISSFSVIVPTVQDNQFETDENLSLQVGGITASGTIEDDDSIAVSSVSDSSAEEGGSLLFDVQLSATTSGITNFSYTIVDVTSSPSDYGNTLFSDGVSASDTLLTIPSGLSRFTISIETNDDNQNDESSETFTLSVGGISATGTIRPPATNQSGGSSGGGGNAGAIMSLILALLAIYRRRRL